MRFVRFVWRLLVGIKDALVLLAMLLFFAGVYLALSSSPNPKVASSGALLLDFRGSLVEQPADADPLGFLSGDAARVTQYRLRDLVRAIDAAASDGSVKAVVLDLDAFAGGGQAAIATAGAALDKVRRAGKPVLAFATGYTDDSYQLASHASEIWVDPLGAVLLAGPGGSRLYYKGLLDKLGVTARVYKVGEFKSAVEPYIRADQSPAARQANQALADALWQSWRDEVGAARPKAQLADYVGRIELAGGLPGKSFAESALAAGLADHIGDRAAFGRRVAALAGDHARRIDGDFARIPFDNYLAAHPARSGGGAIGVVTVAGDIVDGIAPPGTAGGETIARLVLDALAEKDLKALVVRIDSPGGSVTGSDRIRSAIMQAKARGLPVVVSMGSVAASGGYWVATAGDRILAEPSTITGSIGVFGILPTFEGALAKLGLSADGVATTPLSGQPDVLKGTSPQIDRLLQAGVEQIYARFLGLVSAARHLPVARVNQIGQGRVWAGGAARQLGLVDAFGGLDDAIAEAARRAGLDPASVHPVYIEREPSFRLKLLRDLFGGSGGNDDSARDPFSRIAARPEALVAAAVAEARKIARGPAIQVRCLECPATPPSDGDRRRATTLLARIGF